MTTCDWSNHQPFLQLSPEVRKRRQFQRPLTPSLRKISGPVIMMSSSSSSWVRPQNPSPNLKVALAYLSALEQCDERKLMDTFDDTLEHRILPKSLGRPVLNKEHFGNYFQSIASMFERGSSRRVIHEVIEAQDTVILHVTGSAMSTTGVLYQNEYLIILHMMASSTGDGSRKIGSVKEFVDSVASSTFFPQFQRAKKKVGANAR